MDTANPSVLLILARELASNAATPMFVVDAGGNLIFYNEPAEQVLGLSFGEAGSLSADDWGSRWRPKDCDTGEPLPLEDLPLSIAFMKRRAAHRPMAITGADGVSRNIQVTAFPLFARANELVGGVAIFWTDADAE
jgi:PAS domain-containing protein